jgi:UDP-N-acetylmuramoyl-L-alanyl-D-glutamate--2,6-diaminopimelate ligase
MKLHELVPALRRLDLVISVPDGNPGIRALTVDSREVVPGALFLATRGALVDGHRFIPQAVAAGAVAVIAEHQADAGVPVVVVRDGRRAAQAVAQEWYGHPARALRLIGITGTNGKTTSTMLVRHLLNLDGDAGNIGTLGAYDGAGNRVESSAGVLTTPGPVDLQATLRAMVDAGVRTVAMEASSHALDQGRLDALDFVAGVFTNLTREHLDYHGSMQDYGVAKLRLADLVASDGVLSINADDPAWHPLLHDSRAISWGVAPTAHVRIENVHHGAGGSRFTFAGRFGSCEATVPIPGNYNVANAAGAAAAVLGLGMSLREVVERLATAPQVPGRMERILDEPFRVVRDYAHTPDAIERALAALRVVTPGRLFIVFGCGGERDKGKRSIMGRLAVAGADGVIVTSDNPRHEDPERIIDDVVSGLPADAYLREADRERAIQLALDQAAPGDTVLLAGKGHETYQVVGDDPLPFNERQIVLDYFAR